MSLLLDTHALLWWLAEEPMDEAATARIGDPSTVTLVSAASVWEIAIKRAKGRLGFDGSIVAEVSDAGFELLPISAEHAEAAGSLPLHHADPFDRLLVAQAQLEGLTLVTRDDVLDQYGIQTLRC